MKKAGLDRGEFRAKQSGCAFRWGKGEVGRGIAFWGVFLFFFLLHSFAAAAEKPEFSKIRVGIGDCHKTGLWTSVELKIKGGDFPLTGIVAVTVPDGDGTPSQVVSKPVMAVSGQETPVRMLVRFGRGGSELSAEFIVEGKTVAQRTFKTGLRGDGEVFADALQEQPLYVVVGDTKAGVDEAVERQDAASKDPNRRGMFRPAIAHVTDVSQLPVHWCGYEGVDAMVIATSNPDLLKFAPDDARLKALDDWIRMGGRLTLCVCANAKEVLAENAPLSRFAPGKLETTVPIGNTAAWEQYAGSSLPIPPPKNGKATIEYPKLAVTEGIEASIQDLPLVIRTPRGFGQILFVAADIDRPPFTDWNERALLVGKLLDMNLSGSMGDEVDQFGGGYGYTDLSGQLRSSLDEFTGVKVIPFALVAMMIIAYIVLIGPGDYFFLKKVLRRMEMTWITFPLIVIVVCATAYWLAYYLKGDKLRVHQVDLVDIDAASNTIRGTTWLNIFSPRMESFDLSISPMTPVAAGEKSEKPEIARPFAGYFSWFGLPGTGLGGMDSRGGDAGILSQPYRLWSDAETKPEKASCLEQVPISVWATKGFTGRWRTEAKLVPPSNLEDVQQDLIGTITNPYDFALNNAYIIHGHWVYELKDYSAPIEPGETVKVGLGLKRYDLRNFLTGVEMVKDNDKDQMRQVTTDFQRFNRNSAYILRRMMFYEASGGYPATHFSNDYQSFVDLSLLLKTDRAILIADAVKDSDAENRGATLLRDGKPFTRKEDRHSVYYRFVLPVKKK
jgi:hypothetical protein